MKREKLLKKKKKSEYKSRNFGLDVFKQQQQQQHEAVRVWVAKGRTDGITTSQRISNEG